MLGKNTRRNTTASPFAAVPVPLAGSRAAGPHRHTAVVGLPIPESRRELSSDFPGHQWPQMSDKPTLRAAPYRQYSFPRKLLLRFPSKSEIPGSPKIAGSPDLQPAPGPRNQYDPPKP